MSRRTEIPHEEMQPPVRCDDPSTWRHKGEKIDLPRLFQLIEENGGPDGLDLHGCDMTAIDLSSQALESFLDKNPTKHECVIIPPETKQGYAINLQGAHLESASLLQAHLERAHLARAHLDGANLRMARLRGAYLVDAQLKHVDLHRADLQGADLGGAQLEGANLHGAQLQDTDFSTAQLRGADLSCAHVEDAYLYGTQLKGANLHAAQLHYAYLYGAELEGADLSDAELQNAVLSHAQLRSANVRFAHLERIDLYNARSLEGAFWYGAFLDNTRMRREQLGAAIGDDIRAKTEKTAKGFHQASEAYLLLKNNFHTIGRHEDASWAYVKEQQMGKMSLFRQRRWLRWARDWLYELVTGYGERPWNPLIMGTISVVAFAIGYAATGAVGRFNDAVVYSIATFATFNLARTAVQPQGAGVEIASSVEALLGIGVLALFVFTLGNRMRRS